MKQTGSYSSLHTHQRRFDVDAISENLLGEPVFSNEGHNEAHGYVTSAPTPQINSQETSPHYFQPPQQQNFFSMQGASDKMQASRETLTPRRQHSPDERASPLRNRSVSRGAVH